MDEENITMASEDEDAGLAPAGETKADKFLRLAPPRVNKVIGSLQSLAKLSSRGSYEYTPEQVEKMFAAIKDTLAECEASFQPKEEKKSDSFSF